MRLTDWRHTDVMDIKKKVIQRDLVNLLIGVIEHNIHFWHEQISGFWGSKSEIMGISVPTGIALMYVELKKYDPKNENELDILTNIRAIVNERKQAGMGIFAKRSESTTDKFYNTIKTCIKVKKLYDLSEQTVKEIEGELVAIRDVKGKQLQLERLRFS
jgi:hypothetical protein